MSLIENFLKNKNKNSIILILNILLICSLILYCFYFDYSYDYIFGDRELLRGKNLFKDFQFYGSEIGGAFGSRVPGGFLSYYLYLLTFLFKDPAVVYLINFLLISSSLIFFSYSASKIFDKFAATVAAILLITSYDVISQLIISWNPTFGFGFYLFGISFFMNWLVKKNNLWLIFSIIFISLSAQFHLTYLLFIFVIIIDNFFSKRIKFQKLFLYTTLIFIASYSPLIYKILLIDKQSIILSYVEYFKTFDLTSKNDLNLKKLINFAFKSISFVQVSDFIKLKIPFMLGISVIWASILLYKKKKIYEIKKLKYLLFVICLFYIFIGIYFFNRENIISIGVTDRHILFISPLYSILSGFSLSIIFNHYYKLKYKYLISISILLFLILKIVAFNLIVIKGNKLYFHYDFLTYKEKKNFIKKINLEYNTSSSYLLKNLSFSVGNKDQAKILFLPMQYMIETFDFKFDKNKKNLSNCLIIINKNEKLRENYFNYLNNSIYNLDKIYNVFDQKKFIIIEYKTLDNFCINNTTNHYILSEDEKISLNKLYKSKPFVVKIIREKDNSQYFFNIVDKENKPIDIYIKLNFDTKMNQFNSELISKRLRNSFTLLNGFWESTKIDDPKLIIKDNNGDFHSYNYFKGELGNKITTPLKIFIKNPVNFNILNSKIFFTYKKNNLEKIIRLQ